MSRHILTAILYGLGMALIVSIGGCRQTQSQNKSTAMEGKFTVSSDNMIGRASQSRSLIFPLSESLSERPFEFSKVEGKGYDDIDAKGLMYAVNLCNMGISWVDSNDHWSAIVVPSASSDIFAEYSGWHPSDEEIVDCVRKNYGHSFFYKVHEKGYDTFEASLKNPRKSMKNPPKFIRSLPKSGM